VDLRSRLTTELTRRLERNPRYSLRAFARSLALHHTTVARLVNGTRRASAPLLHRIGRRLGLSDSELVSMQREEVAARVLEAAQLPDFRADCRWIAMKTGVELDDVNRALHLLIHERRLEMRSPSSWTVIQP
jgi:plasmid maintenance system antidote protein VapI